MPYKVFKTPGVSDSQIKDAERTLGMKMTSELKSYLKTYGMLSVGSLEFYGLNTKNRTKNIIDITKKELSDYYLYKDYVVIENLGDGHFAIYEREGVFEYIPSEDKVTNKLSNSLEEYIISRVKKLND